MAAWLPMMVPIRWGSHISSRTTPSPITHTDKMVATQYRIISFFEASSDVRRPLISLSIRTSMSFDFSRSAASSSRIRPFSKLRSSLWLAVSLFISYLSSALILSLSFCSLSVSRVRAARCSSCVFSTSVLKPVMVACSSNSAFSSSTGLVHSWAILTVFRTMSSAMCRVTALACSLDIPMSSNLSASSNVSTCKWVFMNSSEPGL
mmetsp:Transcript_19604/g.54503  ORF Transcript_19604/g.54503 Transcript_19604/m.54503 type:complete len:206 (-) Transcript_19604:436-1053(-)